MPAPRFPPIGIVHVMPNWFGTGLATGDTLSPSELMNSDGFASACDWTSAPLAARTSSSVARLSGLLASASLIASGSDSDTIGVPDGGAWSAGSAAATLSANENARQLMTRRMRVLLERMRTARASSARDDPPHAPASDALR